MGFWNIFNKREVEIENLRMINNSLTKELNRLKAMNSDAQITIQGLESRFKKNLKEDKFNNKYPKINQLWAGRYIPNYLNTINVDVRNFFTLNDSEVKKVVDSLKLEGKTDDEKVLSCLIWVQKNIKYKTDLEAEKVQENWMFAFETLHLKIGDCEDQAILLANMIQISKVGYWKVRLTGGWVINPDTRKKEGHVYLTYYCEEKDKFVILDSCYYPNQFNIKDRLEYKDEINYLDIWFSWNEKYIFGTDTRKLKYFEN